MQNTIKILIDLKKEIYRFDKAQQGDDVILDITLLENGVPRNLTGETVELIYINANNTVASVTGNRVVINGNNVKITCPRDCTRSYGIAKFQLRIISTYQVSTFPLALTIVPGVDQGQQISQNIATIIEDLTNKNIECKETLDSLNAWVNAHGDIVAIDTRLNDAENNIAENIQQTNNKVDKVLGKGLSTNDFTNDLLTLVNTIVNKVDLNTFLNKVWSMSNMGQDVKTAMTGGSVAVVGKNTVLAENIVDSQIIERCVSFLNICSKNIFDKDYCTSGIIKEDGLIASNSGYVHSDYISVNSGDKITITTGVTSGGCSYDANKNVVGKPYTTATITRPFTFTVPAGVSYIKFNIGINELNKFMICKGETLIDYENISYNLLNKILIDKAQIKNFLVDKHECNFIEAPTNLFNKNSVVSGLLLQTGVLDSSKSGYYVSDFIPVNVGDKITVSKTYSSPGGAYDKDRNFITDGIVCDNIYSPYTFTITNPTIKFVRLNLESHLIDSYMVVRGDNLPNKYIAHEYKLIKDIKITEDNLSVVTSKWHDKRCVTFGDSITWYDKQTYNINTLESGVKVKGYQSYLEEMLGLTITNQGVSGNTTPQVCTRIKAFDFTGYDLVTLMSGTNDFRDASTEQIGIIQTIGSIFDETTFIGAYQTMIESILTRYPNIRIQIFTPFMVWRNGVLMPETYIDALKSVGELYGIPVLDLYHNSGINDLTKGLFIVDDTSKVNYQFHPSTKGYERLSMNCIVPFVENN